MQVKVSPLWRFEDSLSTSCLCPAALASALDRVLFARPSCSLRRAMHSSESASAIRSGTVPLPSSSTRAIQSTSTASVAPTRSTSPRKRRISLPSTTQDPLKSAVSNRGGGDDAGFINSRRASSSSGKLPETDIRRTRSSSHTQRTRTMSEQDGRVKGVREPSSLASEQELAGIDWAHLPRARASSHSE